MVNTGYSVGWIESGEFLRYTVDVTQNGMYVNVRFARLTIKYLAL